MKITTHVLRTVTQRSIIRVYSAGAKKGFSCAVLVCQQGLLNFYLGEEKSLPGHGKKDINERTLGKFGSLSRYHYPT
jgi:hypothetical protein